MFSCIKRWYSGETKIDDLEVDPELPGFIGPMIYTEYHWSAKIARIIINFYLQNWQWVWSTIIGALGLCTAVFALK